MDRYVLVVVVNPEPKKQSSFNGFETARKVYEKLKDISSFVSSSRLSPFPACSLSGSPGLQKCYFAIQAFYSSAQFCSVQWEEVCVNPSDGEESTCSAVDECVNSITEQNQNSESITLTELFEEAAEALHQLADKLPPPGRFLLDVMVLCEEETGLKEFLPVIGSLKHMEAWHSADICIITEQNKGWTSTASYLSAQVYSPDEVLDSVDEKELWRGALLIREKKFVSEVLFEGFSLKIQNSFSWRCLLNPQCITDTKLHSEVYHYYQPLMELLQLVKISDFPQFLCSSSEFHLSLSRKSAKAQLLLDQLRTLRGEVGALFSLSFVISSEVFPPAAQLSATKWREFISKRPKVLTAPNVDLKGERGRYLVLVQGAESGGCRARLILSANQVNGAVAMAAVNSLIRERHRGSSGSTLSSDWLGSLPHLHGDEFLRWEAGLDRVQMRVLQECLRRKGEVPVSLNDVKVLLNLTREQYQNTHNRENPRNTEFVPSGNKKCSSLIRNIKGVSSSEWPERSVLRNYENLQRTRHKTRFSSLSRGPTELLGPKDVQKSGCAPLDAGELLKHFTAEGLPSGDLQPLCVLRGENAFQLSSELTPRKASKLPFTQASSRHYHGIDGGMIWVEDHSQRYSDTDEVVARADQTQQWLLEFFNHVSTLHLQGGPPHLIKFCLDKCKSLERDRNFARLTSRLIRFETQTTCCREPCPLPLALSPAPTPSPFTNEDTENPQNLPQQLKRRSRETDTVQHQNKRLMKSESSECSGASQNGVPHPAVKVLRQNAGRSQSTPCPSSQQQSSTQNRTQKPSQNPTENPPQNRTQSQTESRSQKHNRMLKEVVLKTLKHYGISDGHQCFEACSRRLFDVSKLYLKDLKTSRGLHEEMKKAAGRNAKQVIDWVLEKTTKK